MNNYLLAAIRNIDTYLQMIILEQEHERPQELRV